EARDSVVADRRAGASVDLQAIGALRAGGGPRVRARGTVVLDHLPRPARRLDPEPVLRGGASRAAGGDGQAGAGALRRGGRRADGCGRAPGEMRRERAPQLGRAAAVVEIPDPNAAQALGVDELVLLAERDRVVEVELADAVERGVV